MSLKFENNIQKKKKKTDFQNFLARKGLLIMSLKFENKKKTKRAETKKKKNQETNY